MPTWRRQGQEIAQQNSQAQAEGRRAPGATRQPERRRSLASFSSFVHF
jgi:hypothetical protein